MLKAPLIEQTNTDPSLPVNMYYSLDAYQGQPGLVSCPGYYTPSVIAAGHGPVGALGVWDGFLWAIMGDVIYYRNGGTWIPLATAISYCYRPIVTIGLKGLLVVDSYSKEEAKSYAIDRPGYQWESLPGDAFYSIDTAGSDVFIGCGAAVGGGGWVYKKDEDGAGVWGAQPHAGNSVYSIAAESGQYVYSCSADGNVCQMAEATGVINWTYAGCTGTPVKVARGYLDGVAIAETDVRVLTAAPAVIFVDTYFTTAYDIVTEELPGARIGYVYAVGNSGGYAKIRCYNTAGTVQWTTAELSTASAGVSLEIDGNGNLLFLEKISGRLRGFSYVDGSELWDINIVNRITMTDIIPVTINSRNYIYLVSDGRIEKYYNAGTTCYWMWSSEPLDAYLISANNSGDVFYNTLNYDTGALDVNLRKYSENYVVTETSITGAPFRDATYQDGYYICLVWGSNRFYISSLEDPKTWDQTDYEDAEYLQGRGVACESLRRNLFIFKEHSYEIYYNSGDSDFPFIRQSGGTVDVGIYAAQTLQKAGETLYWMADDHTVKRLNGYMAETVSTPFVGHYLESFRNIGTTAFYSWTYKCDGNEFYVLGIRSASAKSLQYNITTGLWNFITGGGETDQSTVLCCAYYNGTEAGAGADQISYWCGSLTDSYVFRIREGSYAYNSSPSASTTVYREKKSQVISASRERMFFKELEVWAKTGTDAAADITLYVSWSDDMGTTWSTARELNLGNSGEYLELKTLRLGSSYNRIFKIYSDHDSEMTMIGGYLS